MSSDERLMFALCWAAFALPWALALDNGLALTPPMGWNPWKAFGCNTDCINDPDNCISDRNIRKMADLLVSEGYSAVGYEYVNLDGCWMEDTPLRNPRGRLQPDPHRFPHGIKPLADYVHSKGLKFGIYLSDDFMGDGGIHMERYATTFAEWGVDYVKLNGHYYQYNWNNQLENAFIAFGRSLNQTGRPMVYSCIWPVYQIQFRIQPNYTTIANHCNLWRTNLDIRSWSDLNNAIDYYKDNQEVVAPIAGPGRWNNPDMLSINPSQLTIKQSKVQMALWAILASPLIMSVDLRAVPPEYKAILQNEKIIAVNQDPMGTQGRLVYKDYAVEIWTRPIEPKVENYTSFGIAVFKKSKAAFNKVKISLKNIGLTAPGGYKFEDLYGEDLEVLGNEVMTSQSSVIFQVTASADSAEHQAEQDADGAVGDYDLPNYYERRRPARRLSRVQGDFANRRYRYREPIYTFRHTGPSRIEDVTMLKAIVQPTTLKTTSLPPTIPTTTSTTTSLPSTKIPTTTSTTTSLPSTTIPTTTTTTTSLPSTTIPTTTSTTTSLPSTTIPTTTSTTTSLPSTTIPMTTSTTTSLPSTTIPTTTTTTTSLPSTTIPTTTSTTTSLPSTTIPMTTSTMASFNLPERKAGGWALWSVISELHDKIFGPKKPEA